MATGAPPKDFGFGEDEQMLRDLARRFLDENLPVERLRQLVAADSEAVYARGERPGWDEGLWKQIIELGWTGLAVPEEHGGIGAKRIGIAALVEEVGKHALPSPLVPTLCASYALCAANTPEANAWLARIADGTAASLAITDARGSWDAADTDVTAGEDADGLVLSGRACFVQDAFKCGVFVVSARRGDDVVLCAVPSDAAGLSLEQNHLHDLTRDQASLHLEDVRVSAENIVATDGAAALRRAWPSVLVTVAADLCGTGEWQLQTTVEYARERKQFDRQLGFFQAVKHPLVNAMVDLDRARSLLYDAASRIDTAETDDDAEAADTAARMAKSAASDAGRFLSDRSVQLHGGIGFTWESDIHIFFKRSLHNQALYGDGVEQRKVIAERLIGPVD
jgi:alkylation response protein AidB-like acyl-CoA dehydrogenase